MSTSTVLLSQMVPEKPIMDILIMARVAMALVIFGKGQIHHAAKHGLGLLVPSEDRGSGITETKPGIGSRGTLGQLHWSKMKVHA